MSMPPLTPYTYIQCPCSDPSAISQGGGSTAAAPPTESAQDDEDERTFDPRAPRSNHSLYPLEYLLYCEDCHQIRCPRCVAEEIVTYYCPSCLFEVPGSTMKSEGNRCTRSCFQCPICVGPLAVTSLDSPPDPNLLSADNVPSSTSTSYMLTCSYCHWSSTEVGLHFEKSNSVYQQLQRLRNGGGTRLTAKDRKERRKETPRETTGGQLPENKNDRLDIETQFDHLKAFYTAQLNDTGAGTAAASQSSLGDLGISSPGSLARIMSIYSGDSHGRKTKARARVMREALNSDEGFQESDLDESAALDELRRAVFEGRSGWWETTSSMAQRVTAQSSTAEAPEAYGAARLLARLRPVPVLLRTKRSRRCAVCRHIISKPEPKVSSTRFRIKLVAGSYIPSIAVRPLDGGGGLLTPLRPAQFLLTFRNPIFEPVRVTLATPAATPGRFASKVTVLCPQFEISANTDVWDEALKESGTGGDATESRRRGGRGGEHQGEAGKIWERGRNWVSIVVEVVPASLRLDSLALMSPAEKEVDASPLKEDEDILEIPMFVRVEWEADAAGDDVGAVPGTSKDKEAKEKRELAYWCVLGIGRISQE